MRKIAMIILLVLIVFMPLGAATETGNLGFNGGYSTRGTGLLGFNSTYQYLGDISRYFGIGLSTHADVAFNFIFPESCQRNRFLRFSGRVQTHS